MTILASAYQTSACSHHVIKKTQQSVIDAFVRGSLAELREQVYAVLPSEYDATVLDIPVFNYPLIVQESGVSRSVIDARTLVALQPNGSLRARRADELMAKVILAQLALDWADGEYARLLNFNAMPLGVFANWLGEVIAKRFHLNPLAQMQVGILAAVLYTSNFREGTTPSAQEAASIVNYISKATGYKASDVIPVLESYNHIGDIEEFCECARNYTQDIHLRDLNASTLLSVVGGYWYGNAGREIIAVALEYPPVWLSLVFQAITDRSFKKAGLSDVVLRNTYRKDHESFVRALLAKSDLSGSATKYGTISY